MSRSLNNWLPSMNYERENERQPFVYPSPDGKHRVEFLCSGELQMGTLYFDLILNGETVSRRTFGDVCQWSPDSRYFVAQEWLSIDRSRGPDTQLFIVDVTDQKACTIARVQHAFVEPLAIDENRVQYDEVRHHGSGEVDREQCELSLLDQVHWLPLEFVTSSDIAKQRIVQIAILIFAVFAFLIPIGVVVFGIWYVGFSG